MLIVLLLPLPWLEGCTGTSVAQDIVNWTPSLQSAVTTVDSTAALLAPADAPAFMAATAGFDVASNLLANQAKAYLANPTASGLAQLQAQIVTLQQQVNSALLSAARISNSASQTHALAAIQAVSTIVTAILALVESVSSKAQVAQMAAHSTIKLAVVRPYIDGPQAARMVAAHYDEPVSAAQVQIAQSGAERNHRRLLSAGVGMTMGTPILRAIAWREGWGSMTGLAAWSDLGSSVANGNPNPGALPAASPRPKV